MDREYYSIPEAAALLGISRIAVFKKVKNGKLAALRFGRNWAVPASALAGKAIPAPEAEKPAASSAAPAMSAPRGTPPPPKKEEAEYSPPPSDAEMDSMGWD